MKKILKKKFIGLLKTKCYMLRKKAEKVSKCERLHILRSILLQSFQYFKLDLTKISFACKTDSVSTIAYLVKSLWFWMFL